jgi:transposase
MASRIAPISSQDDTLEVSDLLRLLEQGDQLIEQQKQAISDKESAISDREHVIEGHKHIIEEQQKLLKLMEEKLRLARQKRFGASSEKLPFQGDFFDEAELEVALSDIEQQIDEQEKSKPKRRKPGEGFSDKLQRVRIELPLSEEEKAGASQTFFAKIKEELDIIPAQARVIEYWHEKVVFDEPDGSQRIETATRAIHPLGKCMASIQLLAYLLVAKYADALPLYRLEKIFKRHGATISRTTMANWIIGLDGVFKPLIERIRAHQMSGDYLQADETRLQVLKETRAIWLCLDIQLRHDGVLCQRISTNFPHGRRGIGRHSLNRVTQNTRLGCRIRRRRRCGFHAPFQQHVIDQVYLLVHIRVLLSFPSLLSHASSDASRFHDG